MSDFSQRFKTNIATVTQKGVRQDWETPDELFNPLNDEFHFTLDVAASAENAKCQSYYTEADDGISKEWRGVCWMNPPFDNKTKWIKKAYQEAQKGATVVCLVPARTNTNWWHDICMKGEVRFIRGRPKFKGAKHGLPNPLAIVIFTPSNIKERTRSSKIECSKCKGTGYSTTEQYIKGYMCGECGGAGWVRTTPNKACTRQGQVAPQFDNFE